MARIERTRAVPKETFIREVDPDVAIEREPAEGKERREQRQQ